MVSHRTHPRFRSRARRGVMYLAVLGVAVIVTAMALGLFSAARIQGAANASIVESAQARLNAEAGVEVLAHSINTNSAWRTNAQGNWVSLTLDRGSVAVDVTDPIDGNFANRPYDPVLVRSTGTRGGSTHMLEVQLQPSGVPITALSAAMASVGDLRVNSGRTLNVNGATISTNGTMNNAGTVKGAGQCTLSLGLGVFTGGCAILSPAKSMPPSTVQALYTSLGTTLGGGATSLNKVALGPGVNTSSGGPNAEGIYILNSSSDVTITNIRLYGTLVVNAPGKNVTITGPVFLASARPDYPVLIVNGKLILQADRSTSLVESAVGVNLNPSGMPYNGVTNTTSTDTYPCEIQGLVHSRETVLIQNNTVVRGCVIAESTASPAIDANDAEVVWNPDFLTTPPMGYTTSDVVRIKPGTWKQVVLP